MEILDINRLAAAKRAYSTRHVDLSTCTSLTGMDYQPQAGDLVLAKVASIGSHPRIELPCGRRAQLHRGDEILLAYGNRYAPDQYEAYVPDSLEPCHMAAAGGIAAKAVSWHDRLSGPTAIEPLGVVCGPQGQPVNLRHYKAPTISYSMPAITIAVFGSSMNAGKTITAASLVKGFADTGYKVGALKITGTAAGGDPWCMRDHGAHEVMDFTDAGFASTFLEPVPSIVSASLNLLRHLGHAGCDVAVIEVADGLYQKETAELAKHPALRSTLNGVLFAASDALGAVTGTRTLTELGHTVLGISGAIMRSPLASREAASQLSQPLVHLKDLHSPAFVESLVGEAVERHAVAAE